MKLLLYFKPITKKIPSFLLLFIVLSGVLSEYEVHAQILYSNHLRKKNLRTNSTLTSADADTKDSSATCYYKRTSIVDLKYEADTNTISKYYPMWTYQVVYKLMNTADTTQFVQDTLKIMSTPYPDDNKYYDVKEYTTNWKSCKIRVLNVCGTSGTSMSCLTNPHSYPFLPEDIELELSVRSTSICKMDDVNDKILSIVSGTADELEMTPPGLVFDCWHDERFLRWTNLLSSNVLEYELEWVYIPDGLYVPSHSDYFNNYASSAADYFAAFELAEPVRITTRDNYYPFPEEYPSSGKLYYRVRPIGRLINTALQDYDQVAFYTWAGVIALDAEDITFAEDKNWQRVTTFAEEGKFKKVISYYDGLYRSRQSLTHLNSDNTVIVAETLYDHEGRGVVQLLPYPEECQSLSYKADRRKDMGGSDWNKYDFELTSATNGHKVNNTAGASRYYSASNPFIQTTTVYEANLYIPDAELYPYTQVEYMMDGTGRVARTSGVGPNHLLGSGHETKYYYATPLKQELIRLFGSNVGQENHYKKNFVVDANGQVSTSYMDQEGRVIATALVGNSPSSLMELPGVAAETLTVDLSDKNQINGNNSTLGFKQFNPIVNAPYTFKYTIPYAYFNIPESGPCIACTYKLEIRIEGPGLTNYIHTATISPSSVPDDCVADGTGYTWNYTVNLPQIGDYYIYKNLIWDGDLALANITENIIENSADVLANFQSEFLSQIDINDCDPFLQNEGHTYNGNVYEMLAGMECEGMFQEMVTQVSPGGFYFEDAEPGTPGWQLRRIDNATAGLTGTPNLYTLLIDGGVGYGNGIDDLETPGTDTDDKLLFMQSNNELLIDFVPGTTAIGDIGGLSQTDLMNLLSTYWNSEWAKILVRHMHPEYCHYIKCREYSQPFGASVIDETTSSAVYDLKMTQITGLTTQYSAGPVLKAISPQGHTYPDYDPYSLNPFNNSQTYNNGTSDLDPWPNNYYSGDFTNFKTNYVERYITNFIGTHSIWEYSHPSDAGGTTPSTTINAGINGMQGNELLFSANYNLGATDADNSLWNIYRGSYLQAKTNYRTESTRLSGLGCPILSIPEKVYGYEDNGSPDLPNNESEIDDMANDILDNLNTTADNLSGLLTPGTQGDLCYESCENKANLIIDNILGDCITLYEINQWMNFQNTAVSPALGVNTALEGIQLELINYCMANCTPPLAYAIITDADLDGMENTTHPLHGAYLLLDDLESALDLAALIDAGACTDITNLALIDSAGDANNTLQMQITENCDNVDCFKDPGDIQDYIKVFINHILNTSGPFLQAVASSPSCTYCGCMPETTLTSATNGGITTNAHYPSGACVSLSKDCDSYGSINCTSLYSTGGTNTNAIGSTTGTNPVNNYYLFSQNITDCAGDCYFKFYTIKANATNGSPQLPMVFENALPASVIDSIYNIANIVQTGPRTFTGTCSVALFSPYTLAQYHSYNSSVCTAAIGFEINLNGCGPELVCYDDTTYTIESDYTFSYTQWQEDCIDQLEEAALANAQSAYNYWVSQQVSAALKDYQATCLLPGKETFTMQYILKEYHYTLYYYDQADNLVQTVPPVGVQPVPSINFIVDATANTVTWNGTEPGHTLKTIYQYNSLNQPIEQTTPDGGLSLFYYDDKGRITHSQNEKQRLAAIPVVAGSNTTITAPYSRTLYDELGRIKQVSERTITFTGLTNTAYDYKPLAEGSPYAAGSGANTEANNAPVCSCYVDKQITRTYYETGNYIAVMHFRAENTRSRVAYTTFQEHDGTAYDVGTHYSYDIHGNVKTMINELNHLIHFGDNRYKRIDYKYDLVSGKVNQVQYQPGRNDKFIHKYTYDADNRLKFVETSADYMFYEMDAKYYYYLHGPLARMETGERKVQGSDYSYTLHGWLKGVNAGFLTPQNDMGKDAYVPGGGANNPNRYVASDGYGYVLDYYAGDYKPAGLLKSNYYTFMSAISGTPISSALYGSSVGLYNGNITRMYTALALTDYAAADPATALNAKWEINGSAFHYDQLNRIMKSQVFLGTNAGSFASVSVSPKYGTDYTYDANGNILTLQRKGHELHSGSYSMDNLTYYYNTAVNNQLLYVTDAVTGNSGPNTANYEYDYDNDLKTQTTGNYAYDKIGNLTKDVANDVTDIKWSVYGKVREVIFGSPGKPNLEYVYDAAGQRVMKISKPKATGTGTVLAKNFWTYTIYSRDAQGNILTIYTVKENTTTSKMELVQDEVPLYGSSRLGVWNANRFILASPCSPEPQYSSTNTAPITTCTPVGQGIPAGPVSLGSSSPSTFMLVNLHQSTFNVAQYQHGTSGQTSGNANISTFTIAGASVYRERNVPVIGKKQYEFTDHLGNVLLTISDTKKGYDGNNDGISEYYHPIIFTTSDYYPFGMPMPGRYTTNQKCTTIVVPETTQVDIQATQNFNSPTVTDYGPASNAMRMTYDGWYPDGSSSVSNEVESGSDKWLKLESRDDAFGMRRLITVSASTTYTLSFDFNKGTTAGMTVEVWYSNTSGALLSLQSTNTYTTNGTKTISGIATSTYTRLVIIFKQTDNLATQYLYLDEIKLAVGGTNAFYSTFNAPTITATQVNSLKNQYNGWTPWQYSELYSEVRTGSDKWIKTTTTVSNHGAQQYFTGLTPGQAHTMSLDINMGTITGGNTVSVIIWDVNSSNVLSNERTVISTSSGGSLSGNFTPLYDKILVQIRRSSGTGGVSFYFDNYRIYRTVIQNVYQVSCSANESYRFGYNGQEKDNEIYGEGNALSFEYRIYDPRICRLLSVDPLTQSFPWYTPYQFAGNKPIWCIDMLGLQDLPTNGENTSDPNTSWRVPMMPIQSYDGSPWSATPGIFLMNVGANGYNGFYAPVNTALEFNHDVFKWQGTGVTGSQALTYAVAETYQEFCHAVSSTIEYHKNTPIGDQLADSYGNPHFWEGAAAMLITERVAGGVGKSKSQIDLVPEKNVSNAVKNQANSTTQGTTIYRVQGGGSKYRFVMENGKLRIAGDDMLFVNFGQKGRAFEFAMKRGSDTYIISFNLKQEFVDLIRKNAVPQKAGRSNKGSPQVVDPTKAPDQYGIPKEYFDQFLENVDVNSIRLIKVQ
jgi:RHS repeat-associated protein